MADVTIQRTGELLKVLFEILINNPEGVRAKDAIAKVKEKVTLTEYEKGEYSSGSQRVDKIIRFATIDCVKAGWLIKEKGIWTVTEEGIAANNTYKNPESFYRRAQKLYREWRKATKKPAQSIDEGIEEESPAITYEEAEEQAWSEIDSYLRNMPPYEFQNLVGSLLEAMGYHVSWIAPPGKDGGVDIVAWNDPLGTKPPRIKVQVKREQNSTNVGTLRSFMAILGDDDVGLFVSTGGFTRDAEEEARTQQIRQVTLIDLQKLYELWIDHLDKLSEEAKDLFPLKPIYFLAPSA
jgi:restriction system protein